jgi:hypothetical protein
VNRTELHRLALTRPEDAQALMNVGRFDAAYYLAGYAIECALKACIAKNTREHDFPPKDSHRYYQHNLESLSRHSACFVAFQRDQESDTELAEYWNLVKEWNEESRYQLRGDEALKTAEAMLRAVSDEEHGSIEVLIQILVREQIDGGAAVLNALCQEKFPISGAFWCRMPDSGYWKLILASPFVSQTGPLFGVRRLRELLQKYGLAENFFSDIALFSPNDPEYLRLREFAVGPGGSGVGPAAGTARNLSFEDAWLYE